MQIYSLTHTPQIQQITNNTSQKEKNIKHISSCLNISDERSNPETLHTPKDTITNYQKWTLKYLPARNNTKQASGRTFKETVRPHTKHWYTMESSKRHTQTQNNNSYYTQTDKRIQQTMHITYKQNSKQSH